MATTISAEHVHAVRVQRAEGWAWRINIATLPRHQELPLVQAVEVLENAGFDPTDAGNIISAAIKTARYNAGREGQ